jgi:hypothetical protein
MRRQGRQLLLDLRGEPGLEAMRPHRLGSRLLQINVRS